MQPGGLDIKQNEVVACVTGARRHPVFPFEIGDVWAGKTSLQQRITTPCSGYKNTSIP